VVAVSDASLTREQWATVLDEASPATFGELVATLEDLEAEFVPGEPTAVVEAAISPDGPLTEDEDAGGAFAVYRLDTEENDKNAVGETEEAAHVDANPTPETDETPPRDEESAVNDESAPSDGRGWRDADFTDPESGLWVTEQVERGQWMGHKPGDKQPFSPWADPDAPVECKHHEEPTTCAECGHSAQFKWGYEGNYTDHEEALTWAERDPRLAGLAFIQREDDPLAFVDGDDVRCPETGEVHPVFEAFLEHLGVTYADISVSGAGVHAVYLGSLPEGVKQAVWEIDDEPWGANDDLPAIEIYDGKHVCIATGEHVPGTPDDAGRWDDDALEAILAANDQHPTRASADDYEEFDASDYEASATSSSETTEDIRDVYAALDRLDAQRVAERTIVDEWLEPSHADYRAFVPTWAPSGYDGTANFVTSDVWKDSGTRGGKGGPACMAAIDAGLVTDRDCPRRVNGETWWKAVDHLRELGFDIPEYVSTDTVDAESDPAAVKALDVTLNPEVAWRAAGAVTPDELDSDLQVPTTGDGWECPHCGDGIDVVRAAALDMGIAAGCCPDLDDETYHNAYQHARRTLDAPLPEYVNHRMATERWDIVKGAIRQLDFCHLDEDALESEISGRGDDVDGDAELTLDPSWRDSDSGESVLVFPSGTIYEAHPDHEGVVDVLRFVALDAGAITWDEFTDDEYLLSGDTFRHAYETARMYGAPLPRWQGTDAYHTAVLPSAEELVDEDVGNDERLQAARDGVGDLYAEAAETDEASLLRVLPALGKTRQVFAQADEYPALYTAGRKELMAEGVNRAEDHGVSAYVLPVFAENGPPSEVTEAAAAAVREHGQHLLGQMWQLRDRVETRLEEIGAELPDPSECDGSGEDDVQLDRESCPVADGDHGLGWWLAVHAARERGFRPQQIHENAPALFGRHLPCTCSDGEDVEDGEVTCPYTEGWETATDPEAPVDVLIGHYAHANVEGARTYSVKDGDRLKKEPRVVALDEFAGDAFQRDFGGEYPDHAAWLAGALREDVDDREDVYRKADDLWHDEDVREWLAGDGTAAEHAEIAGVLGAADAALDAVETAEWLLENRRDACSDLGVEDALDRLTGLHPEWDAGVVTNVTAEISATLTDEDNRGGHTNVLNHLDELAERLRETQLGDESIETALEAALQDTPHVDGGLASLVEDAVAGYRQRDEGARARLDAARTALQGGREGCETLAMHAEDGYAHPLAYALLYGLLAPSDADDVATVRTETFTFGRDEGTTLNSVAHRKTRILVDRNQNGAVVNRPPSFAAGGGENAVVALDATGRSSLWELILGRDVVTRDIHESMRERREFLREVYGLQIVQTSQNAYSYEGDPTGKNLDDDVELVAEVGRQYADTVGQQPAVITTKGVETHLEERLSDVASATEHYGNLKGSNALADSRLAVLLGCQHFSDVFVERWAALAGEEVHRTGRGSTLDYNSPVGNELLRHMQEDQVMQAALRFGRDSGGALVFAHTAALRPDLPVVAEGTVVETFSKGAQATARALSQLVSRRKLTIGDVVDALDDPPQRRTVRRHLNRFVDAGYLKKTETANGLANEFAVVEEPRPARVELPHCDTRAAEPDPGRDAQGVYYTWSVRVHPDEPRAGERRGVGEAQLPAPSGGDGAATASAPPG